MNERSPVHEDNGNTVTLKEYILAILDERDKALKAAFVSQQEALNKAAEALSRRLDALNALRDEYTEDRGLMLTRDKYETEHTTLEQRVNSLESWRGKALGFGALLAIVAAAFGALLESVVHRALGG